MKALPALALLLLVAGAAHAGSPQKLMEGTAVAVQVAGPETQLQGPLGVVHVGGLESSLMEFEVEGAFRLEVDHATFDGRGTVAFESGAGTERPEGVFAAASGVAGRDNRELVVFPGAGQAALVQAGSAAVSVATPASIDVHRVDQTPRLPESIVAQGLRVSGSGLEVRGSFTVALWEWDFRAVRADGTAAEHWTGIHSDPFGPLPDGTQPALRTSRHQQAFLVVTDGVLRLDAGALPVAYMPRGEADVHGDLTLEGVRADMAGQVAKHVSADRFTIGGDLRVDLREPANGRVPFAAAGEGNPRIEVDGATLQWTGPSDAWPAWATWGGMTLLALLAPPAAVGARRGFLGWESRRLARAELLLEMEAYADARRAARPLLRSARLRSEAVVIHVESLLGEGRAAEALPVLDQPRFWTLAPALRDYLAARAQAVLGNVEEAREALSRAVAAAPDLLAQAAAEPSLRPLIHETPEGYT